MNAMFDFLQTHPSLIIMAATILVILIIIFVYFIDKSHTKSHTKSQSDPESPDSPIEEPIGSQDEVDNGPMRALLLKRTQDATNDVEFQSEVMRRSQKSSVGDRFSMSKLPNTGSYVNFTDGEIGDYNSMMRNILEYSHNVQAEVHGSRRN